MNPQRTWYLISIAFIAFLGIVGQHVYAEETLYVNNTLVNVRSSPTAALNNILMTVPKDTPVVVLTQQGTWYHIRLPDGREGWISSRVLTSRGPAPETRGRSIVQPIEQETASSAAVLDEKMIFIPGGSAIIGSDEKEIDVVARKWNVSRDALTDELPQKKILVQGFYIDQYEVTNAQYKKFVEATRYPPPLHWQGGLYPQDAENHPVTFVSWDDARAYAQWAGKRLPTAEEWEVAARGLRGQTFPWGETFDRQQVNIDNNEGDVAPAGSYPDDVSGYKVYDLGGNVAEWTSSPYEGNPNFFILKGSSWKGALFEARGANNTPGDVLYQLSHIGFRCAKSGTE